MGKDILSILKSIGAAQKKQRDENSEFYDNLEKVRLEGYAIRRKDMLKEGLIVDSIEGLAKKFEVSRELIFQETIEDIANGFIYKVKLGKAVDNIVAYSCPKCKEENPIIIGDPYDTRTYHGPEIMHTILGGSTYEWTSEGKIFSCDACGHEEPVSGELFEKFKKNEKNQKK